jgi:glutathione synthase/RimK-type ligase-like ATP-grasp enzyme
LKVCFAKRIKKNEILKDLSKIYYPLFIQEYIQKKLELRVIVVGKEVFSVAIHSQTTIITSDDWRTSDVSKLKHEIYNLPEDIKLKLLQFCSISQIQFAAFDFILSPENKLIFLECNPKGEWYWLEEETGIPIAKSIAYLLINKS